MKREEIRPARVEILKTGVERRTDAKRIVKLLSIEFPDCAFNFDLDDCDRILRAELPENFIIAVLVQKMMILGFPASVIE